MNFIYEKPEPDDFRRYQNIGIQIMEVLARNNASTEDALRALEMTAAIAIHRIGEMNNADPIPFIDAFAANVRAYILQIQSH